VFEKWALAEETIAGEWSTLNLVQQRNGLQVVAGKRRAESGDGAERLLRKIPNLGRLR
jgi:hypothetical protein